MIQRNIMGDHTGGVSQLMGMVRNKHFLASSFNKPAELMVVVAEVHCKYNYTTTVKK